MPFLPPYLGFNPDNPLILTNPGSDKELVFTPKAAVTLPPAGGEQERGQTAPNKAQKRPNSRSSPRMPLISVASGEE